MGWQLWNILTSARALYLPGLASLGSVARQLRVRRPAALGSWLNRRSAPRGTHVMRLVVFAQENLYVMTFHKHSQLFFWDVKSWNWIVAWQSITGNISHYRWQFIDGVRRTVLPGQILYAPAPLSCCKPPHFGQWTQASSFERTASWTNNPWHVCVQCLSCSFLKIYDIHNKDVRRYP